MEVRIRVHKQVNALGIYDTIQKKVKGDLFLSPFSPVSTPELNRRPLVQTTSVLNHSAMLPPLFIYSLYWALTCESVKVTNGDCKRLTQL
jgi:hypothetical protein